VNYLAHLVVAERVEPSAGFLVGSLLPDFVRGRLPALPSGVSRGVDLHRWVDRVTDADPLAARTRQRLRPRHGRFAGILVDVLYDHCLARRFADWSPEPYPDAIERYHATLATAIDQAPASARPGLTRLVEAGWMRQYADLDGIRGVLWLMQTHLSSRFGRSIELEHAVDTFAAAADAVQADFDAFFASLLDRVDASADNFTRPAPPAARPSKPPREAAA